MDYPFISPYYPGPAGPILYPNQDAVIKDMEYLQQMYPKEARKYQKQIIHFLDHIDYTDSIIYDEYPDRFCLFRIAKELTGEIRKEEDPGKVQSEEKWTLISQIVEILLYYEILKRRHQRKSRIVRIY